MVLEALLEGEKARANRRRVHSSAVWCVDNDPPLMVAVARDALVVGDVLAGVAVVLRQRLFGKKPGEGKGGNYMLADAHDGAHSREESGSGTEKHVAAEIQGKYLVASRRRGKDGALLEVAHHHGARHVGAVNGDPALADVRHREGEGGDDDTRGEACVTVRSPIRVGRPRPTAGDSHLPRGRGRG